MIVSAIGLSFLKVSSRNGGYNSGRARALFLDGASFRFAPSDAPLLSAGEVADRLSGLISDAEERTIEPEATREGQQRRREESEREVERLRLEL